MFQLQYFIVARLDFGTGEEMTPTLMLDSSSPKQGPDHLHPRASAYPYKREER